MTLRRTPILVHLLGAAAASALLAYWALRLIAPATPAAPASAAPAVAREPDAALAARMFGDVSSGPRASVLNVQVSGVFSAGKSSSAVISIDGKPARAVLLGHELAAGVRLAEVRPDGVTLERDGARSQYSVPPTAIAKSSALATTFRREGATLTAPSLDTPSSAAPNAAIGAQQSHGAMPGHNVPAESLQPRHPGPVPTAPAVEPAQERPGGA
jgi:general secretion pathway protein C